MNENEEHRFQDLIKARLAELDDEDTLGKEGQSIVSLDQQSVGRLSRMDALQNQAMSKAIQQRRDSERLRLTAALRRIAEGDYGYCDECGDDIAPKRLALNPSVAKCIKCASG